MTPTKPLRMWAVTRDGEIYSVVPKRQRAREVASGGQFYDPQQRWSVIPVLVAPIKKQERR